MRPSRIDAHQHFWTYDPESYGWIDESMEAIRRDFRPADLKPLLDAHDWAGSVAVQARQCLEETEALLALADENDFVAGVVGWVNLRSDAVREQLERFRSHPRFVGVRHIVQDEPDDRFLLREDFSRGVACLAEHDLTYDILVYPRQLPAAVEFVRRFPDQRLVLDHIAKPHIKRRELEPWASQLKELSRFENLYCKVSGMVTEADWERWRPEDFTPYLDVVLSAFGPRRLMFGSDWPVCTLAGSYDKVLEIVQRFMDPLTSEERDGIFGTNAIEFYKLKERAHES
jgi:L-fuconolactonase